MRRFGTSIVASTLTALLFAPLAAADQSNQFQTRSPRNNSISSGQSRVWRGATSSSDIGYNISSRDLGAATEDLFDNGVREFGIVMGNDGTIICLPAGVSQKAITGLVNDGATSISNTSCSKRTGQTVQQNGQTSGRTAKEQAEERARARSAARQQRSGTSDGSESGSRNGSRNGIGNAIGGSTLQQIGGIVHEAREIYNDIAEDPKKSNDEESNDDEVGQAPPELPKS
jgi:hypothetical protein